MLRHSTVNRIDCTTAGGAHLLDTLGAPELQDAVDKRADHHRRPWSGLLEAGALNTAAEAHM